MFYSGLVVSCAPEDFDAVAASLSSVEGIEVHQSDRASGRFVVVLEEQSVDAETERFRALRAIDGVLDVSLIVHREDEGS